MKTIQVEIKGISPLLMASAKTMASEQADKQTKVKSRLKVTNPREDAEKYAYRLANGNLYLPGIAIKGALLNASSFKKLDKYSLKSYVAGGILIEPEFIDLKTKKYDIDTRTCVLQTVASKPRIVVHRPRLDKWTAKFNMMIDDRIFKPQHYPQIKDLLNEAGQRIGILAFRPAKSGSFGRFEVSKWKP